MLVPIVAVRLADRRLRARMGHRRTHAAVEAGLGSVPVLVRGTDGEADSAQRVIEQWTENEHRAAGQVPDPDAKPDTDRGTRPGDRDADSPSDG